MRRLRVLAAVIAGMLATGGCSGDTRRAADAGRANASTASESLMTVELEWLKDRHWILRGFDAEAPPAGVEPTLAYVEGGFAGKGGCNRYRATVKAGAAAGTLTVGPVAATRMMCPEPASAVETRFLAALARTTRFGMRGDRLVLIQSGSEGAGSLVLSEDAARH